MKIATVENFNQMMVPLAATFVLQEKPQMGYLVKLLAKESAKKDFIKQYKCNFVQSALLADTQMLALVFVAIVNQVVIQMQERL